LRAPGEKKITTTSPLDATWKGMDSKLAPHVEIEQELEKETSRRQAMTGRGRHLVEVERNQEATTGDQPVAANRLNQWVDRTACPIQLE
jgi:hypothetical protein